MKRNKLILLLMVLFLSNLWSDDLRIFNRTGFNIISIYMEDSQSGIEGANLIPYEVLMDQDYLDLDLPEDWNGRMLFQDESGDYYIKDLSEILDNERIILSISDLQILNSTEVGGYFRIQNSMEYPIVSLQISLAGENDWGIDLLNGNILRSNEQINLELPGRSGMEYDIRIVCFEEGQHNIYLIRQMELYQRGIFSIESP